jgi:voltage-gated potassium channel
LAILVIMMIGMVGLHLLEGISMFDAFYMVLTTFTTIGYQGPATHAGRVFNTFLIIAGVGLVFLLVGAATQALLEFEFRELLGRRKMEREISQLKNHYIICGAGRVGRSVASELARRSAPFLMIENSESKAELYRGKWLVLNGDATSESMLRQAGIERAVGLVAATTTDATNTYIILTARSLNDKLKIIARASEEDAEKHMRSAGADEVVSPYAFIGYRIAHSFLRPHVLDFMRLAMIPEEELGLEIEELRVSESSPFAGQTVSDSKLRQSYGIIVLAIKHEGQKLQFNPKSTDMIAAGDTLVVMGDPAGLREAQGLAGTRA